MHPHLNPLKLANKSVAADIINVIAAVLLYGAG